MRKRDKTIEGQQNNRQESRTRINNEQTNKHDQIVTTKRRENQSGLDKAMIISGQKDRVEEFNLEHRAQDTRDFIILLIFLTLIVSKQTCRYDERHKGIEVLGPDHLKVIKA